MPVFTIRSIASQQACKWHPCSWVFCLLISSSSLWPIILNTQLLKLQTLYGREFDLFAKITIPCIGRLSLINWSFWFVSYLEKIIFYYFYTLSCCLWQISFSSGLSVCFSFKKSNILFFWTRLRLTLRWLCGYHLTIYQHSIRFELSHTFLIPFQSFLYLCLSSLLDHSVTSTTFRSVFKLDMSMNKSRARISFGIVLCESDRWVVPTWTVSLIDLFSLLCLV